MTDWQTTKTTPRCSMPQLRAQVKHQLYLEERVAIIREALDRRTMEFQVELPPDLQGRFHQLVMDLIGVCHGDWSVVEHLNRTSKT